MCWSCSFLSCPCEEHIRINIKSIFSCFDKICCDYLPLAWFFLSTAFKLSISDNRLPSSLVWHSQMVMTVQPNFFNSACALQSLSTFFLNFSFQKSIRVLGVVEYLHPSWRCQKQPWTNIQTLSFGITMSGFPGRSF